MAATSNTTGNAQDQASTTLGVGGVTSGQAGATPAHETLAETGGSGGAQLTHSHGEIQADSAGARGGEQPGAPASPSGPAKDADSADSALQSGARGAQDTRAGQGGGTGTGLGSRESGANQSQDDLPPA
jgi:hypothetical protein